MKTGFTIIALIFCTFVSFGQIINIVPYPSSVKLGKGNFDLDKQLKYQVYGINQDAVEIGIHQLKEELFKNFNIQCEQGNPSAILIGISNNNDTFKKICEKHGLAGNDPGSEGYVLKIDKKQIILNANTAQGLFYGIQSLKQLIRGAQNKHLPSVLINDKPAFEHRGVMDDISRGPVPNSEFLKYQIRRAAELKLNLFTYYIEHVVKTEKHPEFAPANGGISIKEWKELSDYAAKYHIQLIGSFQSLGHFEKIISHPKFSHLGGTRRMITPGAPESFSFLEDIYKEMAPAFSSPFFNINCDETWDLARGKTKAIADSIGVARLYSNHINGISKILKKLNKTTLMWGDITLSHPEIFQQIPKETVLLTWEYGDRDSFADFIDPITKNGFDFWVCPGVLNSNRMYPALNMSLGNIRKFVNEGYQKGAKGVLNTVWDDGGRHSFNRDWYGVAYGADQSWNPGNRPPETFDKSFSNGLYGDQTVALPKTIHTLMELYDIASTQELNNQIFWNTTIPKRGESISFNTSDWPKVLEIANRADSLLQTSATKYYKDELQYTDFVIQQYKYTAKLRIKLLEAAGLYASACKIQYSEVGKTRELLSQVNDLVNQCRTEFANLKNNLEKLWHLESREYWFDYAMDPYNQVLTDYDDMLRSLNHAITLFNQNKSLPYPKDIRLDIREEKGNYFQYWLLCGPFPIENETGNLPDFLEPMGGEANAKPIPGFTFKSAPDQSHSWSKYPSPVNNQINLKSVYEQNTTVVAYAYCTIESSVAKKVKATFGSNDGILVYCNGEEVFSIREKRDLILDENECILDLAPGKNYILLKIDNWKAGWGFSFRLPEEKVRHHKHKYKIIDDSSKLN